MEVCVEGVGGEPGAFCDAAFLKQGPWLTGAGGRLVMCLQHILYWEYLGFILRYVDFLEKSSQ